MVCPLVPYKKGVLVHGSTSQFWRDFRYENERIKTRKSLEKNVRKEGLKMERKGEEN